MFNIYPRVLVQKMYVLTRVIHTREYGVTTIYKENIAVFESDIDAYAYMNRETAKHVEEDEREIALDFLLHLSRTQKIDEKTFNFIIENPEFAHSSTFSKEIYYKVDAVCFVSGEGTKKRKSIPGLESLDEYKKSVRPLFFEEESRPEENKSKKKSYRKKLRVVPSEGSKGSRKI